LESSNEQELSRDELNIKRTLEVKLQEIYALNPPNFEGRLASLRKALNFETKPFIEEIEAKYKSTMQHNRMNAYRSRKFKVYQTTHHEIMISPL
jgi:hypothetical protein